MNYSAKLINLQQDGHVKGFVQKSLSEANRQLNAARRAIPEEYRNLFTSNIRADKDGYLWSVVLKG